MDSVIESAVRLGQAGVVPILVLFIFGMAYAMKTMFRHLISVHERSLQAITENTKMLEGHTRAIEASTRASEANRASAEAFREMIVKQFMTPSGRAAR